MYKDTAHKATDKALADLEKRIKEVYQQAYREAKEELEKVVAKMQFLPEMDGDARLAVAAKYDRLTALVKQMEDTITNANREAVRIINGEAKNIYDINYDFAAEQLQYAAIDKSAVARSLARAKEGTAQSPFTKLALDELKEKAGVRIALQRELTVGIVKGDSIPHLAKRIKTLTERNYKDSVRIARTETTRVEAAARLDVGKAGQKMGFKMLKEWVATNDDRTREEHAHADGQRVPIDEPFIVGGEEMMFPGDYSLGASAWNTINCRCTMVNVIDTGED